MNAVILTSWSHRRIEEFRNYACTTGAWFSVAMIPRRTTWEVIDNNHLTTALSYLGQPLTIMVLGKLQSFNVYIGNVGDNPTIRMCVRLLDKADRQGLADIERLVHRDHVTPAHDLFRAVSRGGWKGRQVSTLSTMYRPPCSRSQVLHSVYDATSTYQRKDMMDVIDITVLRPPSVVLLECLYVRKELRGAWQTWFCITAIAHIQGVAESAAAPDPIHPPTFPSVI